MSVLVYIYLISGQENSKLFFVSAILFVYFCPLYMLIQSNPMYMYISFHLY